MSSFDSIEKFFGNRDKADVLRDEKQEKFFEKFCDHPMFAVVGRRDACDNGIYNEVRCIMCDKEFDKDDRIEKNKWLECLFNNKKLLTKYIGLAPTDNLPMFDYVSIYSEHEERPVDTVRTKYLQYTYEADELIEKGILPKDFSFEESFFDYMCLDDYDRYCKDIEKLEKNKVKAK